VRAIRYDGNAAVFDQQAAQPEPAPGEALIRPTRLAIRSRDVASAKGLTGFTGTLGREFVGVVEAVNSTRDADNAWVGRRVVGSVNIICGTCDMCRAGLSNHCRHRRILGTRDYDGCLADHFVLPVRNLAHVPDNVDDDHAVFSDPLASVLHAAHMIRLEGKPYVTVLGDGPVGLLAAQVMARLNASVRLLGKSPSKFGLCEKWGVKHRHVDEAGRRADQDVVVDCTGDPTGFVTAMGLVRPRGTILLKTVPTFDDGATGATVDLTPVVANEIQVTGARCGSMTDALAALSRNEVDTLSLITRRMRLGDGLDALRAAGDPDQIKVVLEP